MEISLAEKHWAAFWEERDKTALQGRDGSAGAEQSGCGLTWRLFSFQEHRRLKASLCRQNLVLLMKAFGAGLVWPRELTQDFPLTAAPSPRVQMLECPPCPRILKTSWEEEFAMELARRTLWCRRCGLCYVGNSCTLHKPDWALIPPFPTTPSVISPHPQQLPCDMLMHLRLHNLPAWLWGKGGISLCLASPRQAGRRPGAHHGPLLFRSAMWRRHLKAVLASLSSLLPGWRAQPERGSSLHKPEQVRHTAENKITCASVKWQCDTDWSSKWRCHMLASAVS